MFGCFRCSNCGVSWPQGADYQPCPECGSPTEGITDAAMAADEAHTRMTHARFERWLDEHDRRGPVERLDQIPVQEKKK